jgi:hypothetical protein
MISAIHNLKIAGFKKQHIGFKKQHICIKYCSPLNKKLILYTSERRQQVRLNIKHMLMFSAIRSLFIRNFLPATLMGGSAIYGEAGPPKMPRTAKPGLINHDNMPVNAALRVHQFVATKHPLYSSALVPRNSFLLPCMKWKLRASFPGSLKSSNNSCLPYTLSQK